MRVLVRHVKRVAVARALVMRIGRARFDRVRREPVVGDVELGDVRGLGKGGIGLGLIAERPGVALVVGCRVVQGRAFMRAVECHHRVEHVVIDFDEFCCVARFGLARGHHHRHLVAHITHLALRQHRMRRLFHRLAVHIGDEPAARHAVDLVVGDIGAGEDGEHAGRRFRRGGIDGFDDGMRMRRAQKHRIGLARQHHIVGVLAGAGQKARVFLALDRYADAAQFEVSTSHGGLLKWAVYLAIAAEPCCTALTMFW